MNNIHLKNHVANRFINDYMFWLEIMSDYSKEAKRLLDDVLISIKLGIDNIDKSLDSLSDSDKFLWNLLNKEFNKNYLITNTVMDKLGLLKINQDKMDWSVFSNINKGKYTFILPTNQVLRLAVTEHQLYFACSVVKKMNISENKMDVINHIFFIDKSDWQPCEHLKNHAPLINKKVFIYKLLCFIFLSDIEEEIIKPGQSVGTKKSGKFVNSFDSNMTIVTSKWNITSIRTEGFNVSGHFAIRYTGEGRTIPKMVYIQPFMKHGYIRKAKAENI